MSPATPASHQEIPSVSETPTPAPAPAPWRIYLDQNAWIQLAQQRLGKTQNPLLAQALQLIQKQASTGEASFPSAMLTGGAS